MPSAENAVRDLAGLSLAGDAPPASAKSDGQSKKKKKKSGGSGGGQPQKEKAPPREWTDDMQADYDRILSVGEECQSTKELRGLITAKGRGSEHPTGFNLYDGFEPSGRMHIAQGVFKVGSFMSSLAVTSFCFFSYAFLCSNSLSSVHFFSLSPPSLPQPHHFIAGHECQ